MEKIEIKETLYTILNPKLERLGVSPDNIDLEDSLMNQGVLDSMGFIEFISQIEEKLDVEFDFEEMDASDFTSINQLISIIETLLS